MRLRSFVAKNMTEAMALVKEALGPDAIIVSAEPVDGGVRIITTTETDEAPPNGNATSDAVHIALINHGVMPRLAERLALMAAGLGAENAILALAAALNSLMRFNPISTGRFALVGSPGAGKTQTCAKLATRAVLAGFPVQVITTDTVRAGATEQLAAQTRVLGLDLLVADGPDELKSATATAGLDLVLIDTPGINPYLDDDREELSAIVEAASAEPVLVLPAGGDIYDTTEMARAFAELGCRRLIPTRLDMAHRLGGLLAASDTAQLAFAEFGVSPSVADGLRSGTPAHLARLLLPEPIPATSAEPAPTPASTPEPAPEVEKAAS
jgi:flagellar biosynthesis protein FlhF